MLDQLSPVRHRRHEDVLVLRHQAEVDVGLLEDDIQAEVFHRRLQVDVGAELEPRNALTMASSPHWLFAYQGCCLNSENCAIGQN